MHQPREPADRVFVETQHLAYFARGRATAISDDIGSHCRAQSAVSFVDVLNGSFTLVAAGQIQIYVRPLATFFREKTFEQQFHADRINSGNAQGVTDGTVRSRATTLDQDSLLPTKLNDVPDDQKVTFQ